MRRGENIPIMIATIDLLEYFVKKLYAERRPGRADWFYKNHVFEVADITSELAYKFGAWEELARAAALLHDIADAVMSRFSVGHEAYSREIARELMLRCGFAGSDIAVVVDDAVRYHNCHGGHVPITLEGKVMATADAICHLKSGFYDFAVEQRTRMSSRANAIAWALAKLRSIRQYLVLAKSSL